MTNLDQKRIKRTIKEILEEKDLIGFEMVDIPDGEKSITLFYKSPQISKEGFTQTL